MGFFCKVTDRWHPERAGCFVHGWRKEEEQQIPPTGGGSDDGRKEMGVMDVKMPPGRREKEELVTQKVGSSSTRLTKNGDRYPSPPRKKIVQFKSLLSLPLKWTKSEIFFPNSLFFPLFSPFPAPCNQASSVFRQSGCEKRERESRCSSLSFPLKGGD